MSQEILDYFYSGRRRQIFTIERKNPVVKPSANITMYIPIKSASFGENGILSINSISGIATTNAIIL